MIYLFGVFTSLSTHCIGHITMGTFMGRGNQYIQLVSRFCKLPANSKQLQAFPPEVRIQTLISGERGECVTTVPSWPVQQMQKAKCVATLSLGFEGSIHRSIITGKLSTAKFILCQT